MSLWLVILFLAFHASLTGSNDMHDRASDADPFGDVLLAAEGPGPYSPTELESTAALPRLAVHFEVCLGMFNQYDALSAALWAVAFVARQRGRGLRRMHVYVPALYPSLGRLATVAPFEDFFEWEPLVTELSKYDVTVTSAWAHQKPPSQLCPHALYIPVTRIKVVRKAGRLFRVKDLAFLRPTLAFLTGSLERWNHSCVLLRTVILVPPTGSGSSRTTTQLTRLQKSCILYLKYVLKKRSLYAGRKYLRFAPRLSQHAVAVKERLGGHYVAVHLRTEQDMLQDKVLDFFAFEQCLRRHLDEDLLARYPMYLAAGNVVFAYPEYQAWRGNTTLRLVNKTDVIPRAHTLRYGREEWAAIEALILVGSDVFVGFEFSTLTEFVMFQREAQGGPGEGTATSTSKALMWDKYCGSVFKRRVVATNQRDEMEVLGSGLVDRTSRNALS